MNIANGARRVLVNCGKILPFVICFIVCISHYETFLSTICGWYVCYGNDVLLSKPISYAIGSVFEYDMLTLFMVLVISVAIETCYWNKIAILYLCINLWERQYFDMALDETTICTISFANVIVSAFLVYKGFTKLKH